MHTHTHTHTHLHPGVDGVRVVVVVLGQLLSEGLKLSDPVVLSVDVTLKGLVNFLQGLQRRHTQQYTRITTQMSNYPANVAKRFPEYQLKYMYLALQKLESGVERVS